MIKKGAPFLAVLVPLVLNVAIASADLPTHKLVDPVFLSGDPWEPDVAYSGPNVETVELARSGSDDRATTPPRASTMRLERRDLLARLFIVVWRMPWLMR